MKYLFSAIFFLIAIVGFSQEDELTSYSDIIPASPTAAGYQKYVELSGVNHSSGAVSASIPLYDVKLPKYNIPLTLNYVSNGLKVGDRSGWVGYGWSLSAIGVVTRTVIGHPDEGTSSTVPYNQCIKKILEYDAENKLPLLCSSIPDVNNVEVKDYVKTSNGKDFEPDQYSYSTPTCSGQFYIDHNMNIIKLDHDHVQIVPSFKRNKIESFDIVDTYGNRYTFNEMEFTSTDRYEYTSSWYVSNVKTFSGESISYKYVESSTYSKVNYKSIWTDNLRVVMNTTSPENCKFNGVPSHSQIYGALSCNQIRLQQIMFEGGSIEFSDSKYKDLYYKLDKIRVLSDTDNKVIREIDFRYISKGTEIFIDKISMPSIEDNNSTDYNLNYYSGFPVGDYERSQDIWGFYNGANNTSLVPQIKINGRVYNSGASRDVTEGIAIAGMLKSIEFPTGGKVEYLYEQNTIFGIDTKKIEQDFTVLVPGQITLEDGNVLTIPDLGSNLKLYNLTLPTDKDVTFNVNVLKDKNQAVDNNDYTINVSKFGENATVFELNEFKNQSVTVRLKAGTYIISMETNVTPSKLSLSTSYDVDVEKNINVGGMRLKGIKHIDSDKRTILNKEYDYSLKSNTEKSSGYLISPKPVFEKDVKYYYMYGSDMGIHVGVALTKEVSGCSVNSITSVPMSYTNVSEINGVNNGKTVYNFQKMGDYYSSDISACAIQNIKYESANKMRSKPVTIEMFNEEGNLVYKVYNKYKLLRHKRKSIHNNKFEKMLDRRAWGLRTQIDVYGTEDYFNNYSRNPYVIGYQLYPVYPSYFMLTNEKKVNYFNNEQDSVVTITDYKLLDPDNFNSVTSTTSLSDDIVSVSKYYCKSDVVNYHNSNIDSVVYKTNDIETSKLKYSYTSPYLPRLSSVYNYKGDNCKEYTELKYNGYNKVTEVKTKRDIIAYIWAYGNTKPVLKAVGITFSELEDVIESNGKTINWINDTMKTDEDSVNAFFNKLRDVLPKVFITTYTYEPLKGISSITDPNGRTTYYDYDFYGRLTDVKDDNKFIINSYEYNYMKRSISK
jgi:YD repeat-containing protein